MRTTPLLASLIVLAILTGTAAAEVDTERTDSSVGMLLGGASFGEVSGFAGGVQLGLGRHLGPVYLYGEYDFLSVGETSDPGGEAGPIRGTMHRLGGNVRYEVAGSSPRRDARARAFIEGGIGRQHVDWSAGGTLVRTDVSFGAGVGGDFRLGKDEHTRVFGYHYAVKTFFSREPAADVMAPASCGGPCDRPTAPRGGIDWGVFFNLDFHWGG